MPSLCKLSIVVTLFISCGISPAIANSEIGLFNFKYRQLSDPDSSEVSFAEGIVDAEDNPDTVVGYLNPNFVRNGVRWSCVQPTSSYDGTTDVDEDCVQLAGMKERIEKNYILQPVLNTCASNQDSDLSTTPFWATGADETEVCKISLPPDDLGSWTSSGGFSQDYHDYVQAVIKYFCPNGNNSTYTCNLDSLVIENEVDSESYWPGDGEDHNSCNYEDCLNQTGTEPDEIDKVVAYLKILKTAKKAVNNLSGDWSNGRPKIYSSGITAQMTLWLMIGEMIEAAEDDGSDEGTTVSSAEQQGIEDLYNSARGSSQTYSQIESSHSTQSATQHYKKLKVMLEGVWVNSNNQDINIFDTNWSDGFNFHYYLSPFVMDDVVDFYADKAGASTIEFVNNEVGIKNDIYKPTINTDDYLENKWMFLNISSLLDNGISKISWFSHSGKYNRDTYSSTACDEGYLNSATGKECHDDVLSLLTTNVIGSYPDIEIVSNRPDASMMKTLRHIIDLLGNNKNISDITSSYDATGNYQWYEFEVSVPDEIIKVFVFDDKDDVIDIPEPSDADYDDNCTQRNVLGAEESNAATEWINTVLTLECPNESASDLDGDGVANSSDDFALNRLEAVDTDSDGKGDNADWDDDNDGLLDSEESDLGTDAENRLDPPRINLTVGSAIGLDDISYTSSSDARSALWTYLGFDGMSDIDKKIDAVIVPASSTQGCYLIGGVLECDGNELDDVVKAQAGLNSSCALLTNGDVSCWYGDDMVSGSAIERTVAAGAIDIAIHKGSDSGGCSITSGAYSCWDMTDTSSSPYYESISDPFTYTQGTPTLSDFESVAVGEDHICLIEDTGYVHCRATSSSYSAQLGDSDSDGYVDISGTEINDARKIGAGDEFTCVLRGDYESGDGEVYCWGANAPTGFSGLTDPVSITTLGDLLCVIDSGVSDQDHMENSLKCFDSSGAHDINFDKDLDGICDAGDTGNGNCTVDTDGKDDYPLDDTQY